MFVVGGEKFQFGGRQEAQFIPIPWPWLKMSAFGISGAVETLVPVEITQAFCCASDDVMT
jgi:hypothetical protein